MAHSNILERRLEVELQMMHGSFTTLQIKNLAKEFACHVSAIRADIIAINNKSLSETYFVSIGKRKKVIERDGMFCYLCGKPTDNKFIIEHKIPASRGGTANLNNLGVAHQSCNVRKRYKDNKT